MAIVVSAPFDPSHCSPRECMALLFFCALFLIFIRRTQRFFAGLPLHVRLVTAVDRTVQPPDARSAQDRVNLPYPSLFNIS
jgi:hypothetical protein